MYANNSNFTKIVVTVNGEPVGNGLLLDSVTFRPIQPQTSRLDGAQKATVKA